MTAVWAVLLPLVLVYATALRWCVERWNAPTQYFAHGWLVPVVATAVVWARRRQWRAVAARPDRRGLWLLVPGLALHLIGLLLMVDSWSAASLLLSVPGAAWLALGLRRLSGMWSVVGLVVFFVPMPIFVEGRLAFLLKEFAVGGGAVVANLLGADVHRVGEALRPAGASQGLYVADACSGLRSLLSMAMVAYCIAFFTGPATLWRRAVLLAVAAPVAIAANVVRIAVICLFARWFGVPFAEGTGHTLANVAEWIADLSVLLLLDAWLRRRAGPPTGTEPLLPATGTPVRWWPVGLSLWSLVAPLLWLGLHRPFGDVTGRAEALPQVVGGYAVVAREPAAEQRFQRSLPRWWELLGTRDFVFWHYRDAAGRRVDLVGLFHDTNWKSVHPPRICIEGSNMDIERDEVVPAPWLGADASVGRIVARRRDSGRRFVTLAVFGTADWCSGSYAEFFWNHLPKALLRRSAPGFLLRVEAEVRGGDQEAAEALCRDFLTDLVPAARGVLR